MSATGRSPKAPGRSGRGQRHDAVTGGIDATCADASSAANTRIPRRGLGTLALMLAAVVWSAAAMAIEEPAYTAVDRADRFEIRDDLGYVVAETVVEGTFDGVGSEGFRRLFGCISGGNVSAEKITTR